VKVVENNFVGTGGSLELGLKFFNRDCQMNSKPGCSFGGVINSSEWEFGLVVN
jgi:hypothetical protein